MKYFAKLDLNNDVIKIHVVHDDNAPTEEAGIEFLNTLYNHSSWKECSKDNGLIRKNGAAIGMTYDEARDAFIHKQSSFASWVFDETTCQWKAPVPYPEDGKLYKWIEETLSWEEYTVPL